VKSKTTAGILALFFGGFGIHRFYLGQIGLGFVYFIFCWTFIPAMIALIDAIIFFTMDNQAFNFKYNKAYIGHNAMYGQQPNIVINNNVGQATPAPVQNAAAAVAARSPERTGPQLDKSKQDPFEIAGDEKYEAYDFDGAIQDYLKSLRVRLQNPEVHFKLACLYSVLESNDNAMFHLSKAVEKGYYDFDEIARHDLLSFLRTDDRYEAFKANGYRPVSALQSEETLKLSDDLITQIESLAKLRDQGILDDEEFKQQKEKLFNRR
jgi:TM2 domain-containing membrane protein YozV